MCACNEFRDACRGRLVTPAGIAIVTPIHPLPSPSKVQQMSTTTEDPTEISVAARVAGEDIACGDFVAVLNEIVEFPSFLWDCCAASPSSDEPVRIAYRASDAGEPKEVIGVCLPFVYVRTHDGSVATIDTRQRQLVRLDADCARTIWKALSRSQRRKKKTRKQK